MKKWINGIGLSLLVSSSFTLTNNLDAARTTLYVLETSPFSDDTASKIGDLLTIVIKEKAEAEDNGSNTSKISKNSVNSILLRLLKGNLSPTGKLAMAWGPDNGAETSEFDASGKNTNKHTFNTNLQARIVDVVGPGLLLIRGTKEININGKVKHIYISGVIRKRDIGTNSGAGATLSNSILSDQLADAQIEIDGALVSKDLQPGLFSRLLRKIF